MKADKAGHAGDKNFHDRAGSAVQRMEYGGDPSYASEQSFAFSQIRPWLEVAGSTFFRS
jgi:hypothetical protein